MNECTTTRHALKTYVDAQLMDAHAAYQQQDYTTWKAIANHLGTILRACPMFTR